jgi:hypothetical protein
VLVNALACVSERIYVLSKSHPPVLSGAATPVPIAPPSFSLDLENDKKPFDILFVNNKVMLQCRRCHDWVGSKSETNYTTLHYHQEHSVKCKAIYQALRERAVAQTLQYIQNSSLHNSTFPSYNCPGAVIVWPDPYFYSTNTLHHLDHELWESHQTRWTFVSYDEISKTAIFRSRSCSKISIDGILPCSDCKHVRKDVLQRHANGVNPKQSTVDFWRSRLSMRSLAQDLRTRYKKLETNVTCIFGHLVQPH